MRIEFAVLGKPATKGSLRAFISNKTRRVVTIADNKRLPSWTTDVRIAARWARVPLLPKSTSCTVTATWSFLRPKSAKNRVRHTVKPDIDKLSRALLDALTGVAYEDDAQVALLIAKKQYGDEERCDIEVTDESPS